MKLPKKRGKKWEDGEGITLCTASPLVSEQKLVLLRHCTK